MKDDDKRWRRSHFGSRYLRRRLGPKATFGSEGARGAQDSQWIVGAAYYQVFDILKYFGVTVRIEHWCGIVTRFSRLHYLFGPGGAA